MKRKNNFETFGDDCWHKCGGKRYIISCFHSSSLAILLLSAGQKTEVRTHFIVLMHFLKLSRLDDFYNKSFPFVGVTSKTEMQALSHFVASMVKLCVCEHANAMPASFNVSHYHATRHDLL